MKGKQHLLRSRKQTFSLTAQSPNEMVNSWVQAGQNIKTSTIKRVLIVRLFGLSIALCSKKFSSLLMFTVDDKNI